MRLLLLQNMIYLPSLGGANKCNRLLWAALAGTGRHECRVVAPALGSHGPADLEAMAAALAERGATVEQRGGDLRFRHAGVEVAAAGDGSRLRELARREIRELEPEVVVVSSEDPGQDLLALALEERPGRAVLFVHTPMQLPFGEYAYLASEEGTKRVARAAGIVTVSRFVQGLIRRASGLASEVLAFPAYGRGPFPDLARSDAGFVTLVNPCAYKGIEIFCRLAEARPELAFAGVPTWGTTEEDRRRLAALPNVTLLRPADDIERILEQTRVLLMPSMWVEAFPLLPAEAMLRGIPVIASDAGGLAEAKLGVDALIPVRAIRHYERRFDDKQYPVAEVPPQDLRPWLAALDDLLGDEARYRAISAASRAAAHAFVESAGVEPFERLFERVASRAAAAAPRSTRNASAAASAAPAVAELSKAKRALLALRALEGRALEGRARSKDGAAAARSSETISARPRSGQDRFPLSFAQQRLWFLAQLFPDSPFYNSAGAVRLLGALDVEALAWSVGEIQRRHEGLRTTFHGGDGEPFQRVAAAPALPWAVIDLRGAADPAARLEGELGEVVRAPFDLAAAPPLRMRLWRLAEDDSVLAIVAHHIVCDGWSMGVFVRELGALYAARIAGRPSPLPPLPIQVADYAVWQRERLAGERLERELELWRRELADPPRALALPADHPRPALPSYRGIVRELRLGGAASAALARWVVEEEVTPFAVLLAGVQALLSRLSGQRDLVIGTAVANRHRSEVEPLIGFFVNTLALRARLGAGETLRERVRLNHRQMLSAQGHQELPFERLVEELAPGRDLATNPLFQVMFVWQNATAAALELPGLQVLDVPLAEETHHFDLSFQLTEAAGEIRGRLEASGDLFEEATVERLAAQWTALLEAALAAPDATLSTLAAEHFESPRLPAGTLVLDGEEVDAAAIEHALRHLPRIAEARLWVRRDEAGREVLAAALVARGPRPLGAADVAETERELSVRLPSARLPEVWLSVPRLPLDSEGEVDLAALEALPVIDAALLARLEAEASALGRLALRVEHIASPASPLHRARLLPAPPGDAAREVGAEVARPAPVMARVAVVDGGAPPPEATSGLRVGDLLLRAAAGSDRGVVHLSGEAVIEQSYAELLNEARCWLAGLRARGLEPGDRVLLALDGSRTMLPAFWACLLGGLVPAPLAVAAVAGGPEAVLERVRSAARLIGARFVLAADLAAFLEARAPELAVVRPAELASLRPDESSAGDIGPEDVAALFLTSGSTGESKAVPLTHANMLASVTASSRRLGLGADDVTLNWMPLDHVGSLVRCAVRDTWLGCRQIHVATADILAAPPRWLELVAERRVSATWAPNFAFGLLADRADEIAAAFAARGLDLGRLRVLLNTGEAVVPRTARRVRELGGRLGMPATAMWTAWGMSETSSGITFTNGFLDARGRWDEERFVELGRPIEGAALRVTRESGAPALEGESGHLEVRCASLFAGYDGRRDLDEESFTADGWFRTGDLALLDDGRLVVTGRAKDVLILHGQNLFCHEIESAAEEGGGIEVASTAACAVRDAEADTDRLALFFVPKEGDGFDAELLSALSARVAARIGLAPHALVPLAPAEVERTSLGKIRREALRRRYEAGDFDARIERADLALAARGLASGRTLPAWFHRPVWARRRPAPRPLGGDMLIVLVGGAAALRDAVAAELRRAAPEAKLLSALPDEVARVLEAAPVQKTALLRLVHLEGCALLPARSPLDRVDDDELGRGPAALLPLARALSARSGGAIELLVVARGAQAVTPAEAVVAERAALLGLVPTLAAEVDGLLARHVDVGLTSSVKEIGRIVSRELECADAERETAWRDGERYARRLAAVKFAPPRQRLERGGFYVVSGGLGGIGRRLCRELLDRFDARLLIVARGPLSAEKEAVLAGLAARGTVEVVTMPGAGAFSSAGTIELAVSKLERRFERPLDGVFHLAGETSTALLHEEDEEGLATALAGKATLGRGLLNLLERRGGGLFVAFSSVNALFGGFQAGAYSAANAFLRGFAPAADRPIERYVLHWSAWEEVGMGGGRADRSAARARGYMPISVEAGLASLWAALGQEPGELTIGLDATSPALAPVFAGPPPATTRLTAFAEGEPARWAALTTALPRDRFGREVPCTFTVLEALPRRPDGTVDLDLLAAGASPSRAARVAPRGPGEERVAEVWRQVLGIAELGIDDNFFQLGGHSLAAVQAMSRLSRAEGLDLPVSALFQAPTVRALAAAVETLHWLRREPEPLLETGGETVGETVAASAGAMREEGEI